LPDCFGNWFTVFAYFNRLSHAGFFDWLHERLILGADEEAVFADSTHTKVHQHANGATERAAQAVGTSRGGLNTKIHAVSDALMRLAAKIRLTPGNVSDFTAAPELTGELRDCAVVEDKGYDSRQNRDTLRAQGCEPCIPSRSHNKAPEPYDNHLYRSRHCIENFFQRIKVFRRVATRYEKTCRMYLAAILLAVSATYEQFGLWEPTVDKP
jgi:transposase